MSDQADIGSTRVVIVGGGVAGLEALLALHDLAVDRVQLTLVAPEPDFLYKPLLVEEPFDLAPAERHELAPLAEELGARFVLGAAKAVDGDAQVVELDDGSKLEYDRLIFCAGGRYREGFEHATTFPSGKVPYRADEVLDRAASKDHRMAFVVPHGVTWSLPLYEIALMTQRRAVERGVKVTIAIVTPEPAPLAIFGPSASALVGDLLRGRGIEVFTSSTVRELDERGMKLSPGDRVLGPAEVVALAVMEGPSIEGLPSDEDGFIPIDDHARVKGLDGVYAAGDGTNFPIKQGGIATQQADAAAADIAHGLGADVAAEPFRPVLRGKLLTGDESVSLRADVAGGGGEGEASPDTLWWPPHKISARYLAPFLYHGEVHEEPEPPRRTLDVEVALPQEWHEEPMALDPHRPPGTRVSPAVEPVQVSPASPERFRALVGDDYSQVEQAIEAAGRLLAGRVIWHVNSTARGGGVAEMLQSLLAYARGAGVDVRWVTISGDEDFFRLTKRLHNRLHGADGDGGELGESERETYERGLMESTTELISLIRDGDLVYLHDPQTAGIVPHIRSQGVRVVWRCHVGVDHPNDLVRDAWSFLHRYVSEADAYVFSRRAFVWDGLEEEKLWLVPPSIDAFSAKNEELDQETVRSILNVTGLQHGDHFSHALYLRHDGSRARVDRPAELDQDGPLPADAPLITQVSRWDRLKDPAGVLQCFSENVEHSGAHLLLAGPSVTEVADDPEGAEVLEEVRGARKGLPGQTRARVHLASLPMDDVEENAAIVNAIQRRSDVVLQKSLAEGFGLTVAEAMWKSRPVVAGRIGGIQDQIVDGESGLLVDDPADLAAVGEAVDSLLADQARAEAIGVAAHERVRKEFLGSRHLVQYMGLIGRMLDSAPA